MKHKLKYILSISLLLGICLVDMYAQYHINYTQFLHNEALINPAYVASKDYYTISANVRRQWAGIEDAPSSQSLSVFGPLPSLNIGIGLNLVDDKVGVSRQQLVNMTYAYKIVLRDSKLSFGLNVGLKSIKTDFGNLLLYDGEDPNFDLTSKRHNLPFVGLGSYFQKENYSIGLSVPYFMDNVFADGDQTISVENKLFFFLNGAVLSKLNNSISLKSGILFKGVFNSNIEVDFIETVYINDQWNFGLSYKSLNSLGVLAEYGFNKKIFITYSYDISTSKMFYNQWGSHEITLTFLLDKQEEKQYINPRYF
jgi:type IX secretion system PorP/SprF family membrane protein